MLKIPKHKVLSRAIAASLLLTFTPGLSAQTAQNDRIQIPELGSSASAVLSEAQAEILGDAWLRMFRAQAPTLDDPLLMQYSHDTISSLAQHTRLNPNSLKLVIVENPSLNAFAVPGGVIGLNTGLFMLAENEGQFASVLSHELAHLTQNHFQRRVEQQQASVVPMIAMLLGSLALAANGNSQAGMAALVATQAAAQQNALRYSRSAEQEADRIGIQTLNAAGFNPGAQGEMFEIMKRQSSGLSNSIPEYLLSHPYSERRASDALLRARQYPLRESYREGDYYYYMRVRASLFSMSNDAALEGLLERELTSDRQARSDAAKYGLALVYSRRKEVDRALDILDEIPLNTTNHLVIQLARAEAFVGSERYDEAQSILDDLASRYNRSFPVEFARAENLFNLRRHSECVTVLERIVESHRDNPDVWFLLAESYGLAGNLVGVHKARAEWFALNGAFSLAVRQLDLGINQMRLENYHLIDISRTEERKRQLRDQQARAMEL